MAGVSLAPQMRARAVGMGVERLLEANHQSRRLIKGGEGGGRWERRCQVYRGCRREPVLREGGGQENGTSSGRAFGVSVDFHVVFVLFGCQPIREPLA